MLRSKLAFVLICIMSIIGLSAGCTIEKNLVPGDTIHLAGPTPPSGVSYVWQWTITDPSGKIVGPGAGVPIQAQEVDWTVPGKDEAADSYTATLQVTSYKAGEIGGAPTMGCVLDSCVSIYVNKQGSCSITGETTVCKTVSETYSYVGTAGLALIKKQPQPLAYLVWSVDTAPVESGANAQKDYSGSYNVDWSNHWNSNGDGAQTHTVYVGLYSAKENKLLPDSTCSLPVTVLPLPKTDISPT